MYPVSSAFLQAVQENTRVIPSAEPMVMYYWTGKITTKNGVVYEFGTKDIVKGSVYISSQCCGSTEIELGTVYSAEMGITLLSDIDRYTLEDALVELFYHLRLADGSYETVPMGIFEISEANRTAKCLELKGYDFMLRFEKNFNGFQTVGQVLGGFFCINRYGQLELRKYGVEPVMTVAGKYVPPGVYTIVEVRSGKDSDAGWGRLKSGVGFISLDYAKRV